jgi:outer membrane protein OmpA-like peptidoglycan-associated protein
MMNKTHFTPVFLAVAALLAACSSTPRSTALLSEIHSEYQVAQNNPNVATYAALELKQAGDAVAQADAVANDRGSDEKIDKLAYLARQKIALTQEVTKQKMAESEVANAGKVRNQLILDQRTNEANIANLSAERSKNDAAQAQSSALLAQQQSAQAQQQTERAQVDAFNAQRAAQDAQARTAQLEAQLADLSAKKTERGMVITLGDVLFGTDLARLNNDGIVTAQKLAKILQLNPQRNVLVEGFTDSTGTAAHNQELSERRAGAVRTALVDMGIAGDRVSVRGYGEAHPVAANDTAQNRQLNRRVEIVLSDDGGKVIAR